MLNLHVQKQIRKEIYFQNFIFPFRIVKIVNQQS